MKVVPGWFRTCAHGLAIVFALWLGVHIFAPVEWIVIYALTAAVSATLPAYRLAGFIGLGIGILVGAWGTYLLRDAWNALSLATIFSSDGGARGGGREAMMLVVAALWLVVGSAFRTQHA
jgi:hypothetical protein